MKSTGPGDTPSRKLIFVCRPTSQADELPCAKKIIGALARRAYRRPVSDNDLETLLTFYQKGRNEGGSFDSGIEAAIQLILASPEFLFRFEPDPPALAAGAAYRISDLELASRLSFFLWSTRPGRPALEPGHARQAAGSRRSRRPGEAHAGRSEVEGAGG